MIRSKFINAQVIAPLNTCASGEQRLALSKSQYFVSTRGHSYWFQPGHGKFSIGINNFIIQNGKQSWVSSNGTYFFEYQGMNRFGFGYSKLQLGVRPDGGIMHSTIYPLK